MKREWEQGDVAFIPSIGRAICTGVGDKVLVGRPEEHNRRLGMFGGVRPLVVIDPEDREQVERLVRLYWDVRKHDATQVTALTEALREFANPKPPKPDEPTGLGAVVEDEDGTPWIRVEPHIEGNSIHIIAWRSRVPNAAPKEYSWPNVAAVRVLSEGVQP